jgi:septal ring factor EnvC (AmiA/AmiB activator)
MGEGEEEAASYNKFACFCKDTTGEKTDAIKKGTDEKAALEAAIAELSANRDKLDDSIAKLQEDIEKAQAEMKEAASQRADDLAEYKKNEADLAGALTGLEEAIKVLKASKEPSLVQYQAVSKTVQAATLLADALEIGGAATKRSAAMFLQQPNNEVPMENYKFHSGDIISSLEGLLDSFRKEKQEVDAEEVKAVQAHDMFMQEKADYVKAKTTKMEQAKKKKDETTESIAANTEELTTTSAELLDNQQYLTQLAKMCADKAKTWDQRSKVRADELSALTAAMTIVKEGVASKTTAAAVRFAQQGVSVRMAVSMAGNQDAMQALEAEAEAEDASSAPVAFLQKRALRAVIAEPHELLGDGRQLVLDLLSTQGSLLKSTLLTSLASKVKADPLAKVKTLISQLIERLLQEAAAEASQKGWCDKAMADAKQKRDYASEEIADLNGQMAEGEARRDKLTEDLAVLEKEIKELKSKQKEAQDNRKEEKAENAMTVSDATAGLEAVNQAIDILTKFYKKAAKGASLVQASPLDDMPDAGFDNGEAYTGAQGASGGIIGMLDVIKSDFTRTISATEQAESAAAKDHLEFMTETGMSLAEKEMAEKEKKKYLDDTNEMLEKSDDRLSDETEILKTSLKELMELKPTCIDTGMSYEERVARREQEIEALKKADCILQNFAEFGPNGVADQC